MTKIVLASSNAGKVREINQLLADLDLTVLPQDEFGIPDAEETGLTFVENAILKARNAAAYTGLPAIADDSGLEVDVWMVPLASIPRVRRVGASDETNLQKLLTDLEAVAEDDRTAVPVPPGLPASCQ